MPKRMDRAGASSFSVASAIVMESLLLALVGCVIGADSHAYCDFAPPLSDCICERELRPMVPHRRSLDCCVWYHLDDTCHLTCEGVPASEPSRPNRGQAGPSRRRQ